MRTMTLLPDAQALHPEGVTTMADSVIVVSTPGDGACCPDCGQLSTHRRSERWRL